MPVKTPVKRPVKRAGKAVKIPLKKTVRKVPGGITWEDVMKSRDEAWKAIRETQEELKDLKESQKKTDESLKKTDESLKKSQESLNKSMGELSNKLGSVVEKILLPDLPQKFKELGFAFNRLSTYLISEGVYAQIDGMLENGTQAILIEVKTTLRHKDIDDHLSRMNKIRQYADEQGDTRQFMGAMAATITSDSTRTYALKHGLFIIEPSGENVKVTKPPKAPRIW
jgi:hypothetical protein